MLRRPGQRAEPAPPERAGCPAASTTSSCRSSGSRSRSACSSSAACSYVSFRFRYREGKNENPKQIHGSTPLEIGWTILPALLLAIIAVPTIKTIFDIQKAPAAGTALEVEVIGKQWWWQFGYTDEKIITANELVIPTETPVRLKLSACEKGILTGDCNVIHSFWVPELAGQDRRRARARQQA